MRKTGEEEGREGEGRRQKWRDGGVRRSGRENGEGEGEWRIRDKRNG